MMINTASYLKDSGYVKISDNLYHSIEGKSIDEHNKVKESNKKTKFSKFILIPT